MFIYNYNIILVIKCQLSYKSSILICQALYIFSKYTSYAETFSFGPHPERRFFAIEGEKNLLFSPSVLIPIKKGENIA